MIIIAIDLKSFYASVECVERGLDPLDTNLLVADESRTEKTICLAVSPSLKAYGISGRARLFEAIEGVKKENAKRLLRAPGKKFSGASFHASELNADPSLEATFITAPPRMKKYMDISQKIFGIYLRYIAPEDIHIYSVDEVFMDVTHYLKTYNMTPHELAIKMIREVLSETGITATAGIGTNLYLAKIAMDIVAKKMPADKDGVRIAELDEMSYRKLLWDHTPITDFWRIGRGIAKRLKKAEIYTMGDIARCSIGGPDDFYNEDLLYKMFGINAELIIDHAWGYEPTLISDIKAYVPEQNSMSSGQVLSRGYENDEAYIVIREMAEVLSFDLFSKGLYSGQIVLDVGYDALEPRSDRAKNYKGEFDVNRYGKTVPKGVHGSINLKEYTNLSHDFIDAVSELFKRITDPTVLIRRMYVTATNVVPKDRIPNSKESGYEQLSLFSEGYMAEDNTLRLDVDTKSADDKKKEKEAALQGALLSIKERYGKNAVLRGESYLPGATQRERNAQVGGHKA